MAIKKNQTNDRMAESEAPHYTDEMDKVTLNFGKRPGGPPVRLVRASKRSFKNGDTPQEKKTG